MSNAGATVASIVAGAIADGDAVSVEGIAVTGVAATNGQWQFSTDGGASWQAVGSVGDANALLLGDTDRLRFLPNAQNGATPALDYRAWDRTSGVAATKVDTTTHGGTTAFSAAEDRVSLLVSSVNDAPGLGGASLADPSDGAGETIAGLFGGRFSDVDAGASFGGIAVVSNAAPASEGQWEYSSDGGTSWSAVGSVSDGASALALAPGSRLRFVPAGELAMDPTALGVRALDDSYSGGFTTNAGGAETRIFVNTTGSGGSSAISANVANLSAPGAVGSGVEETSTPEPEAPEPDPILTEPIDTEREDPEATADPGAAEPVPEVVPELPIGGLERSLPPVSLGLVAPTPEPFTWPPPREEAEPSLRDSDASGHSWIDAEASDPKVLLGAPAAAAFFEAFGAGEFLDPDAGYLRELDRLRDAVLDQVDLERTVVASSVALTTGLSIGYALWLTRGGLLIASLASSLPVWRLVDPIPVLASLARAAGDEDDESLGSLVGEVERRDEEPTPERPADPESEPEPERRFGSGSSR